MSIGLGLSTAPKRDTHCNFVKFDSFKRKYTPNNTYKDASGDLELNLALQKMMSRDTSVYGGACNIPSLTGIHVR